MLKQNRPAAADWHPALIVAAVRMSGTTLRKLSLAHGLHCDTLYQALRRPWPKAQRIIADAIGEKPEAIWPSRYRASRKAVRHPRRATS